jgi:hypothetical protein
MRTIRWWGWAKQTSVLAVLAGFSLSLGGCDQIKGLSGGDTAAKADDDSDSKKKKKKKKKADEESEAEEDGEKPDPEPTAEPTAEPSAEPTAEPTADPSAAPSAEPAAGEEEVTRYPGKETPMGGTVKLKIRFKAYQAADLNSKERAHLAPGTFVNLKASFSNWMLVEYPSGIGELSLGWIQLRSATDNTAVDTTVKPPDASIVVTNPDAAPTATPIVPDASTTATPDAATPDGGGRRPIPKLRIPAPR